jgi:hypothetical protein
VVSGNWAAAPTKLSPLCLCSTQTVFPAVRFGAEHKRTSANIKYKLQGNKERTPEPRPLHVNASHIMYSQEHSKQVLSFVPNCVKFQLNDTQDICPISNTVASYRSIWRVLDRPSPIILSRLGAKGSCLFICFELNLTKKYNSHLVIDTYL